MDNALQVFLISLLTTAITSPFIMRLLISLRPYIRMPPKPTN